MIKTNFLPLPGALQLKPPGWTANQFRVFRILLGAYITMHFMHLVPWSIELFSSAGMLGDAALSPLVGLFPNLLALIDDPVAALVLTASGVIAGTGLMLGRGDRWCAIWAWFVLATLFTRNPLIANPAMPYVGWMLIAYPFIAALPAISDLLGCARWRLSPVVFTAAWVVLALSYSYSGYTKLLSPGWLSGENVALVLENPLARDWLLRDAFLALPDGALKALTWFILLVELLFAPLALIRKLRPLLWSLMFCVQLGFLFLLNFADLTMGMLLFHLLTLDPSWLKPRAPEKVRRVYYDGSCGVCHSLVGFALSEDLRGRLSFQPLQGSSFEARGLTDTQSTGDTFIVELMDGTVLERGQAFIRVCDELGGLWLLLGQVLALLPTSWVDFAYRRFGQFRHAFSRAPQAMVCPLLPPEMQSRFHPPAT
jgi:predicted DCC family thiol-disulfide oxidoreductase YuxK